MNITGYKKKKMEENKKSLCRIPRALTDQKAKQKIEKELYQLGGSLGIDIIIYACNSQNENLFGECWFSMDDFCKKMGYNRTHLQEKVSNEKKTQFLGEDNPVHILYDIRGKKIEYKIETVFECILYKLGSQNIGIVEQTRSGGSVYKFLQVLDEFEIKSNLETLKKTRRMYRVRINSRLKETLFNSYSLIELNEYNKLPDRAGYREFYLNLCRMIAIVKYKKDHGEIPCFTMSVDQLASIFDVNIIENKDRKKRITRILNSINKNLKAAKFDFEYIKGANEKWAYTVKFQFSDETVEYFDEKYKAVFMIRYYENLLGNYIRLRYPSSDMKMIISEKQRITEDEGQKEQFRKWCFSDEHMDLKVTIYKNTSMEVFKMNPEDSGFDIGELFKRMQQSI